MNRSASADSQPVWRSPGMPALLALTSAGFAGFAALMPIAPLWAVHGGADEAGAGLVNGVLLAATVATQPFVPRLLRRFGTGRVLAAGLVLLGLPSPFHLVSDGLGWILLLAVFRGAGFGILTVTGSVAVARLVRPARRGAAIGAYGAAIAVPQLLLMPAGPWLAATVGPWLVFLLGTLPLLGIGAAPRLATALRARAVEARTADPAHSAEAASSRSARRRYVLRGLAPPMVLLLAVTLAAGALITFVPQMSTSPAAATLGLTILTASAAVTRWRLGALADRFGPRRFMWPLVLLSAVGMVVTAAAVRDASATDVVLLPVGMVLVGTAYGGLQNLTLLVSFAAVTSREYGTASAVWNIGFDAGTALGSVSVGLLAAGVSFPFALLAAAGVSLLTLPLALLRDPQPPQPIAQ